MKSFAALLALAFVVSCSDPQCGKNERLIGNTCRRLRVDGGIDTADDPNAAKESDARVADARADRDATIDEEPNETSADAAVEQRTDAAPAESADASSNPEDAGSTSPEPDTSVPAPAAPVCGDGILNGTELCDPKIAIGQPGACLTVDSCKSTDACLDVTLVGDASACNTRCETAPKRECKNNDQCCPSGCTSANDNNCSASCGNKFVDANETCEKDVGAGCPTTCPADNGCTTYMRTGDVATCNVKCVEVIKTEPKHGDSCCPAGATASSDHDCSGCGNLKLESGELCDGNCATTCDDGIACTKDSASGSAASCNLACSHASVTTAAADGCCVIGETALTEKACPGCGNGVTESGLGEQCDDGNDKINDGCTATCKLGVGDDRKDFVACAGITCAKPQVCVIGFGGTPRCGAKPDYSGGGYAECDGSEDCSAGQSCISSGGDSYLTVTCFTNYVPDPELSLWCHTDADCVAGKTGKKCYPTNGNPGGGTCGN